METVKKIAFNFVNAKKRKNKFHVLNPNGNAKDFVQNHINVAFINAKKYVTMMHAVLKIIKNVFRLLILI